MNRKDFPTIHFYDQDFVDLYDQTWAWIQDFMQKSTPENGFQKQYFNYPENKTINQFESILSTFFLVYSNRFFPATPQLDNFYEKQEPSGAIRSDYSVTDGKPVFHKDNPEGINPPLFSWAEFNIYHKVGNKKRIRDIMPILEKYFAWIEATFRRENGLFEVPLSATKMENSPRKGLAYPVDFNAQMAINALYMSELGDLLNDKEISFRYKRQYFTLKTRINGLMWNEEDGIYYDLDKNGQQIKVKTVASFWPLLAEIPNEAKAEKLIAHLKNPQTFGTEHPFPTLAADEPMFEKGGMGFRGSVYPPFTFMVIKGLEKYNQHELARSSAIRHLYYMVDTLHPVGKDKGNVWEAYAPRSEGPAKWQGKEGFPRPRFLPYTALSTITLMIENVIGLSISLPRKTVDWIIPTLEIMGIENLSLKRNFITILSNKSNRGWEIRLESEKLYYFTIDILGDKRKTLPIPSGKCSMLIDKL
ncbi:MAG: trehalase family glycosidase [Spirochaetales bacterium]